MGTRDIDVVVAARRLRADLAKAYPAVKFAVRSSRFAGGEAIDVDWTDGPPEQRIRAITRPFESIDRDAHGEILSGGNRYVGCQRTISAGARTWAQAQVAESPARNVSFDGSEERRLLERTTFDAQGKPHVGAA